MFKNNLTKTDTKKRHHDHLTRQFRMRLIKNAIFVISVLEISYYSFLLTDMIVIL